MITRRTFLAAAPAAVTLAAASKAAPPQPFGAVPSARQLAWHRAACSAFLHFTVNTFTDKEWGYGDEDPNLFQPAKFDADSIAGTLKSAGFAAVILTCKHHDGFCLWPTSTTDRSVRSSSWRHGKGDVVGDLAAAARRQGMGFGVYLSPWDRNSEYYGTPRYIEVYRRQLTELLTAYGPIFEVWHDGANGGDGYYGGARTTRTIDKRTYYDWPGTWDLVRRLQPGAVIFSDVGPDVRWVGNERGIAGDPCWATYDPVGADGGPASPGDVREKESPTGHRLGSHWLPAECDVSIRPGWFWHENENSRVKTPDQLIDLYYQSVGRGANLLLNVPPNRDGLLSAPDSSSLAGFHRYVDATFSQDLVAHAKVAASNVRGKNPAYAAANLVDGNPDTAWATDDDVRVCEATLELGRPATFSVIALAEDIRYGQRIDSFGVDCWTGTEWVRAAWGTSVGPRRYLRLDRPVTSNRLRLRITQAAASPVVSQLSLYAEP